MQGGTLSVERLTVPLLEVLTALYLPKPRLQVTRSSSDIDDLSRSQCSRRGAQHPHPTSASTQREASAYYQRAACMLSSYKYTYLPNELSASRALSSVSLLLQVFKLLPPLHDHHCHTLVDRD